MKVIGVNGSPRKSGNTVGLLQNTLNGAQSKGAQTELVNLYDLDYKGCTACFACKKKNSQCNGICVMKDDLTDVLKRLLKCDYILLGSPIFFGNVTGEMKSFLERLLFPNHSYNLGPPSVFGGKIASGFIYTMNVTEEQAKLMNYEAIFQKNKKLMRIFHGDSEVLVSYDTYQFDDYSKYDASKYDLARKTKMKLEQFPADCQRAFEMGVRLASI
ncbi:MAG: flavodoxin family protein [Erysipelotrichia bacterium]|nr:flavodoxin family protein [Erysipelotrichia bacterium]